MTRLSSFSIFSDPLPDGSRVLLNGCSGALDVLPRLLADRLLSIYTTSERGQARVDETELHPETLDDLVERGHLTRLTPRQEQALVREIALGLHEQEKRRPYFMIAPSLDCNYRCVYCFERPLQVGRAVAPVGFSGREVPDTVLSRGDVPRVFDSIGWIQQQAGATPGGMVVLYGGEPLDSRNRDLVFDIVRLGRERGYFFAAVTNGHDLAEFFPLLGREQIRQVQISFDGPKAVHDRRRVSLDGCSSFDRLVSNIRAALQIEGVELHLRVHVDAASLDSFAELTAFFEREGWTDNPSVIIYASTLYQKAASGQVCARMDVAELAKELDGTAGRFRNVLTSAPGVHVARALLSVFETGSRYPLKGDYCSANFANYLFAPDGCIYACWESVGKASSRIGTFRGTSEPELDAAAVRKWFSRSVADVDGCLDCELALVCGGGCAQYAEYNTGLVNRAFCDDFQLTFQRALADEATRFFGKVS